MKDLPVLADIFRSGSSTGVSAFSPGKQGLKFIPFPAPGRWMQRHAARYFLEGLECLSDAL